MIPGGLKKNEAELAEQVREWVEQCRVSVPARRSYYRLLNCIAETGKYDGTKALMNLMQSALQQVSSHLFSPVELKFSMDFEKPYPKEIYNRGQEFAKQVTRTWDKNGTDNTFGRGVFESLKYGVAFLKQWTTYADAECKHPVYHDRLVMPWQFGVYREDRTVLDEQPILCETVTLTLPEVWQRIWKLPNADKLYEKIKSHTTPGEAGAEPNSFFHQVLSTSQLNTGVQGMLSPIPGGIVQLNSDPNYALMGPVIAPDVIQMHELWVQDEEDWTTIQMIEPDIIIAPMMSKGVTMKKDNFLGRGSKLQPYRIIQPNEVTDWIWGRSELTDIIEPQQLLSTLCEDAKRLIGVEIDKFLGFIGETGMTDENYAMQRNAGYINLAANSSISDLTPHMPPEMLPFMKWLIEMTNIIRGFPPIMQGQGEPGVRAGSHANTLMKTASPTLRDRALLVERQLAACADLTATLKEMKEESFYWTKGDNIQTIETTKFLISDIPEDWRITVDSHSSSPIFSDDNEQRVFAALKSGIVGPDYVIDNTQLPNKEMAKQSQKDMAAAKQKEIAELLKTDPESAHKVIAKSLQGGKH